VHGECFEAEIGFRLSQIGDSEAKSPVESTDFETFLFSISFIIKDLLDIKLLGAAVPRAYMPACPFHAAFFCLEGEIARCQDRNNRKNLPKASADFLSLHSRSKHEHLRADP
jgi:hypothetical protein